MARRSLADFSRRPAARCRRCCGRWCSPASRWRSRARRLRRPARAVSAVALVDVSDSVSDGALAFASTAVAGLARAAAERGDPPPRVVRFAARAEEVAAFDPKAPAIARLPPPAGAATDLALAAGFGAGLVDATAIPRLLLISDGVPTRGDLVATAERLARSRHAALRARPALRRARRRRRRRAWARPTTSARARPFRVDVRLLADRADRGARPPRRRRRRARRDRRAGADDRARARRDDRDLHGAHHRAGDRDAARARDRDRRRPPPRKRRGRAGDRDRARSPRALPRRQRRRVGLVRARAGAPSTSPPTCAPPAGCRATSTSAATIWSRWPTCRAPCCPTRRWRRWTASSARAAGCWSRAARRASARAAT